MKELDAGFLHIIKKETILITIIIDEISIPDVLSLSTCIKLNDLHHYDEDFEILLKLILGTGPRQKTIRSKELSIFAQLATEIKHGN
jgi:hypothetical protein